MASARVYRPKEAAQRIASHALTFLCDKIRLVAGHWAIVANLSAIRRSRWCRDAEHFHRRLKLMLSDGYNFELFYSTQLGTAHVADSDEAPPQERLLGETLLAQAYDLSKPQQGAAAMSVLIGRAVRIAQARDPAQIPFRPVRHANTLHSQWCVAIEAAFRPAADDGRATDAKPKGRSKERQRHTARSTRRAARVTVVEDAASFDRSVPDATAYRASTRH